MNARTKIAGAGALLALLPLAVLLGCNQLAETRQDDAQTAHPLAVPTPAAAPAKEATGRSADVSLAARERPASADDLPLGTQATDSTIMPSMIIRVGDASVEVDSLEPAIALVTQLASRLGGYVANTSLQGGLTQIRSATLTLRIPAARYEEALGGLRPIGDLETVNTSAQDVGEEYVDLNARVQNGRRVESRLVALLATRTGKLDDVLAVERELARVREQIERIEGRLRYLRARAAMSTLTVTVHESVPLIGYDPSTNPVAEAFKTAWRNFVAFVAAFIAALGWVIPLGALAGLGVVAWRRGVARAARRPKAPADTAEATA
jgi:hypothetical protein